MVIASRRRLRLRPVSPQPNALSWLALTAFLLLFVGALAVALYREPLFCLLGFLAMSAYYGYLAQKGGGHLEAVRASRPGESICTFVRRCDYRGVDLVALRAVYEEMTGHLSDGTRSFPVRPDDEFGAHLLMDSEDLDEMAVVIAARAGRSLENYEANPFYLQTKTPFGLALFLSHQPRA